MDGWRTMSLGAAFIEEREREGGEEREYGAVGIYSACIVSVWI